MRVDKYLWSIRVFKTRSLATQACKAGRVVLGAESIKSSREVKIGETLKIRKSSIWYTFKVVDIPKSRVGAKLVPDYCEDLTEESQLIKIETIRLSRLQNKDHQKGRPTKRDRRDMERFRDDP